MGCVVEVTVTEDELVGQMNHMRAWLDHRPNQLSGGGVPGRAAGVVRGDDPDAAAQAAARRLGGAPPVRHGLAATAPRRRLRGDQLAGGVRRPAALFDSLGSRRRLNGAERLVDRLTSTVRFLRMAASELRRLAERIPEVADELELMARQLDAEADDLTSEPEPSPTV